MLQLKMSHLSPEGQLAVVETIEKYTSNFSDSEYCDMLSGLSKMDVRFTDLPPTVQKTLEESAENRLHFMDNRCVGFVLRGWVDGHVVVSWCVCVFVCFFVLFWGGGFVYFICGF